MITEEALPTYQTMINTLDGVRDEMGASPTPWAVWTRAWTAEENRHGDLLNKYLYLSGRVNMKQIERTIQYLIGSGMVSGVVVFEVQRSSRSEARKEEARKQELEIWKYTFWQLACYTGSTGMA